jgi:hypothetical protein
VANKNFVVKNGLTVGNLAIDADSGNLITSGDLTVSSIRTDSFFYANGTPFTTAGALGYTGSAGPQGNTGFTGSAGADGTIGVDGYTGSTGAAGFTGSQGDTGFVGSKGDTGLGFRIAKTYSSLAALQADTSPTGIVAGEFALIETGNVEDADNSKLYLWTGTAYTYVTDLSGAAGITGQQGNTGFTGSAGAAGFTGSSGTAGDTGFVGSSGELGYTGSIGYTGSAGGLVTTSNTAPVSPAIGDWWYYTTSDVLLKYINDGASTYWIDISGPSYNFGVSTAEQAAILQSMQVPATIEYLVVAGGASGAKGEGTVGTGGGGAGGLLAGNLSISGGTTYSITVGAGGATQATSNSPGNPGSNSSIDALVLAYGGGRGGFWSTNFAGGGAGNGGSGGGRGGSTSFVGYGVYPGSPYISEPRQGYDGGNGSGVVGGGATSGGGGGGAGGAGGNVTGGIGLSNSISSASVVYSAGGTGGTSGGTGGTAGVANTGNGGTGGSGGDSGAGRAGGSGIVIIRYTESFSPASATTGSPTITVAGGYRIYKFTSSGSITF